MCKPSQASEAKIVSCFVNGHLKKYSKYSGASFHLLYVSPFPWTACLSLCLSIGLSAFFLIEGSRSLTKEGNQLTLNHNYAPGFSDGT